MNIQVYIVNRTTSVVLNENVVVSVVIGISKCLVALIPSWQKPVPEASIRPPFKKTSSTYCWSRWVREGFEKAPYCKWLVVFESKTICDLFLHCRCDVGLNGCLEFWYLLPEIWSLIIVILSFSEIFFLVM